MRHFSEYVKRDIVLQQMYKDICNCVLKVGDKQYYFDSGEVVKQDNGFDIAYVMIGKNEII